MPRLKAGLFWPKAPELFHRLPYPTGCGLTNIELVLNHVHLGSASHGEHSDTESNQKIKEKNHRAFWSSVSAAVKYGYQIFPA